MPGDPIIWQGEEYERSAAQLAVALSDLRPFWPKIVPLFIGWMREQFATEGGFAGDPWAPLTPAYETAKQRRYPGKGILYASGDLRQAASRPLRTMTPDTLTLTVDDSAMKHGGKTARSVLPYHQEGTTKMVARPLLFGEPLPGQAELEVEEAAAAYADELIVRLHLR